jgi:hypothetical protein
MKKLVTRKKFCYALVTQRSRDGHATVRISVQKHTDKKITKQSEIAN